MKLENATAAAMMAACFAAAAPAYAASTHWNLVGATFAGGATASGTFEFDYVG